MKLWGGGGMFSYKLSIKNLVTYKEFIICRNVHKEQK